MLKRQYTEWKSPISKNAADELKFGDMPNTVEGFQADSFQFRHVMYLNADATTGGVTLVGSVGVPVITPTIESKTKKGSFEYMIYDGNIETPESIFICVWQKVTAKTLIVSGGSSGIGEESFLIPTEPSIVETFVINNKPTSAYFKDPKNRTRLPSGVQPGDPAWVADPNNIPWKYTQGNTQYGEDGGWQPWEMGGGVEGVFSAGGIGGDIYKWWQGGWYNIPISASAKIAFFAPDQWQSRGLKNANYQFRFRKPLGGVDSAWDTVTQSIYSAATESGSIVVREGRPNSQNHIIATFPKTYSPTLLIDEGSGTLWLGYMSENGFFESSSTDRGIRWNTKYQIFKKGIAMPKHIIVPHAGFRASIALRGKELHFKTSQDGYRGSIIIAEVKTIEDFSLLFQNGQLIAMNGNGSAVYHSDDMGKTWKNVDGTKSYPPPEIPATPAPTTT